MRSTKEEKDEAHFWSTMRVLLNVLGELFVLPLGRRFDLGRHVWVLLGEDIWNKKIISLDREPAA